MKEYEIAYILLSDRIATLETNGIPGVRDFFATSALSFLANTNVYGVEYNTEKMANRAYAIADAMMKEREKK